MDYKLVLGVLRCPESVVLLLTLSSNKSLSSCLFCADRDKSDIGLDSNVSITTFQMINELTKLKDSISLFIEFFNA